MLIQFAFNTASKIFLLKGLGKHFFMRQGMKNMDVIISYVALI